MKLEDLITKVKKERPNSFSNDHLTGYVNELEALITSWMEDDFFPYTYSIHKERELIVEPPYDCIYEEWVKAKINYALGELQEYQNDVTQFNADYDAWKAYMVSHGLVEPRVPKAITNWW